MWVIVLHEVSGTVNSRAVCVWGGGRRVAVNVSGMVKCKCVRVYMHGGNVTALCRNIINNYVHVCAFV